MLSDKWERAVEKWETSQRPKAGNGGKNLKTCTACVKACEKALADAQEAAARAENCRKVMEQAMQEQAALDAQMATRLVKLGREQRIAAALELAGMALVTTIFLYCVVSW